MKDEYSATYDERLAYVYIKKLGERKDFGKTIELLKARVFVDLDVDNNILGIEVIGIIIDQEKT